MQVYNCCKILQELFSTSVTLIPVHIYTSVIVSQYKVTYVCKEVI